jgi:hypothetical protein
MWSASGVSVQVIDVREGRMAAAACQWCWRSEHIARGLSLGNLLGFCYLCLALAQSRPGCSYVVLLCASRLCLLGCTLPLDDSTACLEVLAVLHGQFLLVLLQARANFCLVDQQPACR